MGGLSCAFARSHGIKTLWALQDGTVTCMDQRSHISITKGGIKSGAWGYEPMTGSVRKTSRDLGLVIAEMRYAYDMHNSLYWITWTCLLLIQQTYSTFFTWSFVDQSMRDVYLLPQNMSNIRLVWWYNLFFLVSPIIQEFNSHRLGVLVGLYNLCTIEKDSLPLESGKTMRPPLLARWPFQNLNIWTPIQPFF